MAAPPLPVMRYPMRLRAEETASPLWHWSRLWPENRPVLGQGLDASGRAELPLPAGSASGPATQAAEARPCGLLGAGVLTARARERRKEPKVGKGRKTRAYKTGLLVLVDIVWRSALAERWAVGRCRMKGRGKTGAHIHPPSPPLIHRRPGPSAWRDVKESTKSSWSLPLRRR